MTANRDVHVTAAAVLPDGVLALVYYVNSAENARYSFNPRLFFRLQEHEALSYEEMYLLGVSCLLPKTAGVFAGIHSNITKH
jgi:hypothetical protein